MDSQVFEWVVTALKVSHVDEKRYHDEMIPKLQNQSQKLQGSIDAMYVDKLDGKINQDLYDRKSNEWRTEQAHILHKIDRHQDAIKRRFK